MSAIVLSHFVISFCLSASVMLVHWSLMTSLGINLVDAINI